MRIAGFVCWYWVNRSFSHALTTPRAAYLKLLAWFVWSLSRVHRQTAAPVAPPVQAWAQALAAHLRPAPSLSPSWPEAAAGHQSFSRVQLRRPRWPRAAQPAAWIPQQRSLTCLKKHQKSKLGSLKSHNRSQQIVFSYTCCVRVWAKGWNVCTAMCDSVIFEVHVELFYTLHPVLATWV